MPGSGSVCETSKTGTVRKKIRFSPVSSPCVVALLDGDGGEDPDRVLALAHAAVEGEEGAEAGDVGRGDAAGVALDRDQPLVAQAVAREAVGGADADPALPAVAGQQRAGGLLDALAVGLAARVALGVGQADGGLSGAASWVLLGSGGPRPVRGPIPRRPHARQGVPCSGGGSARQRAERLRGVVEVLAESSSTAVGGSARPRAGLRAARSRPCS